METIEAFHRAKPAEDLNGLEDWLRNLEAYLHGPYVPYVHEGELILLYIKARVDTVRGMKIEIYPAEHAPPHFHIRTADINASLKISDCSLLAGEISEDNLRKIQVWHREGGKENLIEAWNRTRPSLCVVGEYTEPHN